MYIMYYIMYCKHISLQSAKFSWISNFFAYLMFCIIIVYNMVILKCLWFYGNPRKPEKNMHLKNLTLYGTCIMHNRIWYKYIYIYIVSAEQGQSIDARDQVFMNWTCVCLTLPHPNIKPIQIFTCTLECAQLFICSFVN